MTQPLPSETEQREFWDGWNRSSRSSERGIDPFMRRQSEVALEWVAQAPAKPLRILEVGCGTGWLSAQLQSTGAVTGIDLSPQAIDEARARNCGAEFLAGDFATLPLEPGFGFVVSADVIAHVPDQSAFIGKIAGLMSPGGIFVLMTQNPFVWNRSSNLATQGKGQIRNWPPLKRLEQLLRRDFRIRYRSSIFPGGDRGLLRVTASYKLNAVLNATIGEASKRRLFERLFIGRELVVVAERN